MMAVSPSFFAFLVVVAHLVILNFAAAAAAPAEEYQRNCPESFSCGSTTGKIRFPFTTDTYPGCGLCTVNCSGEVPTIQLVRGKGWYQLKEIGDEFIIINLRNLRSSRSCELFNDLLLLPSTPSISFNTLHPSLTAYPPLFKCRNIGGELDQQMTPDQFFRNLNYSSYQGCRPRFTVYYRYPPPPPTTDEIPPIDPPNGCTAIQLPMLPSSEKPNASDVFSILDVDFSIQWNVSKQCRQCRNDSGQCSHDPQEFHCLKDGNGNFNLLIYTHTHTYAYDVISQLIHNPPILHNCLSMLPFGY